MIFNCTKTHILATKLYIVYILYGTATTHTFINIVDIICAFIVIKFENDIG